MTHPDSAYCPKCGQRTFHWPGCPEELDAAIDAALEKALENTAQQWCPICGETDDWRNHTCGLKTPRMTVRNIGAQFPQEFIERQTK